MREIESMIERNTEKLLQRYNMCEEIKVIDRNIATIVTPWRSKGWREVAWKVEGIPLAPWRNTVFCRFSMAIQTGGGPTLTFSV